MKPLVHQDSSGFVPLPDGDVVITSGPLGGLGDILIYSTLAERFAQMGRRVYIDEDNTARSKEVLDLVWGANPHIIGTCKLKPNAGYVRQGLFYEIANRYPLGSIEAMERAHGLPPPYGLAPKLYYAPKPFHIDLSNTILVDFSAVSSSIGTEGILDAIRFARGKFRNAPMLQVFFKSHVATEPPRIAMDSYQVQSLREYIDMIAAARGWIGSEAGGQALASAVRQADVYDLGARPEVLVTACPPTFNSRGYTFRTNDYRVTSHGDIPGDYFDPTEVKQYVYELRSRMETDKHLRDEPA
jgi:hypothetical protein